MLKVRRIHRFLWVVGLLTVCCSWAQAGDKPGDKFPVYDTAYYTIHSDMGKEKVQEAQARLIAMAEEYGRRLKSLGSKAPAKLPFYLFSKEADYHAAGGPSSSYGAYVREGGRNDVLLAYTPEDKPVEAWHSVQHEGFHHIFEAMVTTGLPPWINEGLAEYYGYAIWTGDGYVTRAMPLVPMGAIQGFIKSGQMFPVTKVVSMDANEWRKVTIASPQSACQTYGRGWSMVHFLMEADGGKYQKAMSDYIKDITGGKPAAAAFTARFGKDGGPLGKRYEEWWLAQPADPTPERNARATVATLTSFLARAHAGGSRFKAYDDFLQLAQQDKLPNKTSQWLPKELLTNAVEEAKKLSGWSLDVTNGRPPKLLLKTSDGTVFTGTFQVTGKRVTKVEVNVTKPKTPPSGPDKGVPTKGAPNSAGQLQHIKDRINGYHPGAGG